MDVKNFSGGKHMKILALIADIHGNHLALRAVLDDIKKRGVDAVYCLGDLVGICSVSQ
jgi:predicted phosphodiesterase